MRDWLFGTYVALFVSMAITMIEHTIYYFSPVSPASKAMDDALGFVIIALMLWTLVLHVVKYFQEIHKKRQTSKLR